MLPVILLFSCAAMAATPYPPLSAGVVIPSTYLPAAGSNPCRQMTAGQYCTEIRCTANLSNYVVDHIIDADNSHNDCRGDIAGNYIMAGADWVAEVRRYPWPAVVEEKSRVLGPTFYVAYLALLHCDPGCKFSDDTEVRYLRSINEDPPDSSCKAAIAITLVATISFSLAAAMLAAICSCCRGDDTPEEGTSLYA